MESCAAWPCYALLLREPLPALGAGQELLLGQCRRVFQQPFQGQQFEIVVTDVRSGLGMRRACRDANTVRPGRRGQAGIRRVETGICTLIAWSMPASWNMALLI
jgi:hypothetical protein